MSGLFFLVPCFGFSSKDFASVSINSGRWNVNRHMEASPFPLLEKVLGNSLAPFRFLTPFKFRSSRRLRNSRRSNILAARLCWIPLLGEGCMEKKP
jgi:hypothetical protein